MRTEEYKIEALKESFDGERTDTFTKYILVEESELKSEVEKFVKYHSAERFNVWKKIKV